MNSLWHNGKIKDENVPVLAAHDRALRGDGVFDTALVIGKKIAHGHAHFERLIEHAGLFQIKTGFSANELLEAAEDLLQENGHTTERYALNVMVTRGTGARGLSIARNFQPNVIMRSSPLPDEFPPIKAVIAQTVRRNEGSPLSQIKSINYGDNILAMMEAEKADANEAIMLNNAGNVACASVGNVFALIDGTLNTPPLSDGAMNGITRALLIDHHGAQEKSLTPDDLQSAEGLYISNSIRGLVDVTSLNGQPITAKDLNIPKDFYE